MRLNFLNLKNLMKKIIFTGILFSTFVISCGGSQNPAIRKLEEKKEILELNTKLTNLKINLEKQKEETNKKRAIVASLNQKANQETTSFSSSDAKATAKDAKDTASLLNDTAKANKELEKEEKKLEKINSEILKIKNKLNELSKKVEFVNQDNP